MVPTTAIASRTPRSGAIILAGSTSRATRGQSRVAVVRADGADGRGTPLVDRRGALSATLAGVLLAASPRPASAKLVDKTIKSSSLSSFQKADLLADFSKRCETELSSVLSADDAPALMRLLILDAATYDANAKTGGVNGSVALSEECPSELKDIIGKLQKAREAVKKNGPAGQDMLTMADAIVLGAKVAVVKSWDATKKATLSPNNYMLSKQYGAQFQVRLGRLDAATADGKVEVPATTASPEEVQAFMGKLGVKDGSLDGPFAAKAPFWERATLLLWPASTKDGAASEEAFGKVDGFASWKSKYDKSRMTTYRDEYEIDFAEFFNKLANLVRCWLVGVGWGWEGSRARLAHSLVHCCCCCCRVPSTKKGRTCMTLSCRCRTASRMMILEQSPRLNGSASLAATIAR